MEDTSMRYSEDFERLSIPHANHAAPVDLATLRKTRGMTQTELAKAVGIPLRALQKYESGECALKNMTLDKAVRLADTLGIDPRDLLLL